MTKSDETDPRPPAEKLRDEAFYAIQDALNEPAMECDNRLLDILEELICEASGEPMQDMSHVHTDPPSRHGPAHDDPPEAVYKVPLREVYAVGLVDWARATFWCHVVLRVCPHAHDFGADALTGFYIEHPRHLFENLESIIRKAHASRERQRQEDIDRKR